MLPSRWIRVRDSVSVSLLVLFSSVRKAHIFSFGKERTHAFLCRKKSIKRTASLRLDRLCGWPRFDGGYERRHPRSRSSRDPRAAAPVLNIVPDGAQRRAPCACGRGPPSRTQFPHGEWWPVRASRALQHLSSRGYALPSRWIRVRDSVSVLPCNAKHCIAP